MTVKSRPPAFLARQGEVELKVLSRFGSLYGDVAQSSPLCGVRLKDRSFCCMVRVFGIVSPVDGVKLKHEKRVN
jgi:hypothetical protein